MSTTDVDRPEIEISHDSETQRLPEDDEMVVGGPGVAMTKSMWRGTWVGGLAGGIGGAGVGAIVGLIWAGFNHGTHDARLVVICVVAFALAGAVIAFMLAGMAGAVVDGDPQDAPEDSAHHRAPRG